MSVITLMNWPLAVSNFTILDKLKVGYWLLKEHHWSQGEYVRKYERQWEKYTGAPHAIMVSSGSAANHLLAFRRKWELEAAGEWPKKNRVVFPVVNWISAISPWIQLGFEPVFMDVGANLCCTGDQVGEALKEKKIAAVFYTTLLGLSGDIPRIRKLCQQAGVPLYLDNCEASFSYEPAKEYASEGLVHICNIVPCSTSFYFSHHTSGNQEGGMIFCQTDEEDCFYRMARNHGMTRGMPDIYKNPDAHPHFDFHLMGSNHRSTNLLAYMASLDFDRAGKFARTRRELARLFSELLDPQKYELPHRNLYDSCPMALPIIAKQSALIHKVKEHLKWNAVEHRPIVGGNLLRHTAFKRYADDKIFPRADHIHDNGLYIGLHTGVTKDMVKELAEELNRI